MTRFTILLLIFWFIIEQIGTSSPIITIAPSRIVSTNLASDEILLDLLPSPLFQKRVLALSPLVDDPRYSNSAKEAALVPIRFSGHLEHLLHLEPDLLILASYNRPEILEKAKKLNIPFLLLDKFQSIEDVFNLYQQIGKSIGQEALAQQRIESMQQKIKTIRDRVGDKPKPLVLYWNGDDILYGKGTMMNSLIEAAGGRDLAQDKGLIGWVKVNQEFVYKLTPQVLIVGSDSSSEEEVMNYLQKDPRWKGKTFKLIVIPRKQLDSLSSNMILGLQELHGKLFPCN